MTVKYMALDKETNDLFKPESGGIIRVDNGRFVVQQVSCKLKTALGEWILDREVGFLNLEDLVKNYNIFDLQSRVIRIVTGTQGVISLDTIDISFKNRHLKIDFTATTRFGFIDTSIPWDDVDEPFVEPPLPVIVEAVTHNGVIVTLGGIVVTHTPSV